MTLHSTGRTINTYKATQVRTASSGELLLMLYDGTIRFINQALLSIERKDCEGAHNAIIRAERIVSELMITLNVEKGGDIARNLNSLYCFMKMELVRGNVEKSPEPLENVRELAKGLRDTWQQAIKGVDSTGQKGGVQGIEAR